VKIEVDTHTHSIASLHAYSTIAELVKGAKKNRLKGFVLSEHGPALQGGLPHPYYFSNLTVVPKKIDGIRVFRGVELNIMDDSGTLDLSPRYLRPLDLVIAGLHEACFPPQEPWENTKALIAAIANPFVDGISHPGNPAFPIDIEEVVIAAVRNRKFLEINNSSFKVRKGSEENCRLIAELAKKRGAFLSCASDAHYWLDVGNLDTAKRIIDETKVHPDQIINHTLKSFEEYSRERKKQRFETG